MPDICHCPGGAPAAHGAQLMVKFIHTADWHLGMQAHFLPAEARARFAQDRFTAVTQIAALAQEHGCAFVVVAGDVFDSNHVDRRMIAKAIEALAAFTVPVYLLPGNHDPLSASSVCATQAWLEKRPANAVVLEDAEPIAATPGVEVVGVPWHTKHRIGDPVAGGYSAPPAGVLRVVVGHGIVDELSPNRDDPSLISAQAVRSAVRDGHAQYVALGDRHSVTEIEGTDGRAWYSGTPVASDYGELAPNEVLLVELGDGVCAVERLTVGAWTFEALSFDFNGEEDVRALDARLAAIPAKHTAVVKLALRGTLSLAASALLEQKLDEHGLTCASLNTWERHTDLVVAPDEADLAALEVSGYARAALDELRAEATGSGAAAVVAGDALNLLYRLAR